MIGPRHSRLRVGEGDRPSRSGRGDGLAPVGNAGGSEVDRVFGNAKGTRHGHLRYSCQAEADDARREIERRLRLKRLEQVRQQSRQHAATIREEYRQRREENTRAVVRESKREFEATRTAEVLAFNQQLQNQLLQVGSAHRMAMCTNVARERGEERSRALRSASAELRRKRNLTAGEKQAAKIQEARRPRQIAEHRQEVWRGEGETGRARAKEEAARHAVAAASRREREEFNTHQLQQRADKTGVVMSNGTRVIQAAPRLEDFKTSRVHALVLQHGMTPGARLMGVETTTGDPTTELQRKEAAQRERRDAAVAAESRAEERGREALVVEKDRRLAEGLEDDLKRLHELDRLRRQGNGAAEVNLAAMRAREIRRARFGESRANVRTPEPEPAPTPTPEPQPQPQPSKRARPFAGERRRPPLSRAAQEARAPHPPTEINATKWQTWPNWWPTPPPRDAPARAGDRTSAASQQHSEGPGSIANRVPSRATSNIAAPSSTPPEGERLRLMEEARRGLLDSAARAQEQGRGRRPQAQSVGKSVLGVKGNAWPGDSRLTSTTPSNRDAGRAAPSGVPVRPSVLPFDRGTFRSEASTAIGPNQDNARAGRIVAPSPSPQPAPDSMPPASYPGAEEGDAVDEVSLRSEGRHESGDGEAVVPGESPTGEARVPLVRQYVDPGWDEVSKMTPQDALTGRPGGCPEGAALPPARSISPTIPAPTSALPTTQQSLPLVPITVLGGAAQPGRCSPVSIETVRQGVEEVEGPIPDATASDTSRGSLEDVVQSSVPSMPPSGLRIGEEMRAVSGGEASLLTGSMASSLSQSRCPLRQVDGNVDDTSHSVVSASAASVVSGAVAAEGAAGGLAEGPTRGEVPDSFAAGHDDSIVGMEAVAALSEELGEADPSVSVDFDALTKALLEGSVARRDAAVQVKIECTSRERSPQGSPSPAASANLRRQAKSDQGTQQVTWLRSTVAPATPGPDPCPTALQPGEVSAGRSPHSEDASYVPDLAEGASDSGRGEVGESDRSKTSEELAGRASHASEAFDERHHAASPPDGVSGGSIHARQGLSPKSVIDRGSGGSLGSSADLKPVPRFRGQREIRSRRLPAISPVGWIPGAVAAKHEEESPKEPHQTTAKQDTLRDMRYQEPERGSREAGATREEPGSPPVAEVGSGLAEEERSQRSSTETLSQQLDVDGRESGQDPRRHHSEPSAVRTESGTTTIGRGEEHAQTATEEGKWSAATSSCSTLPPLNEELAELLARHRRLDEEAEKLTRRAEADASQWNFEVVSSSVDRDVDPTSPEDSTRAEDKGTRSSLALARNGWGETPPSTIGAPSSPVGTRDDAVESYRNGSRVSSRGEPLHIRTRMGLGRQGAGGTSEGRGRGTSAGAASSSTPTSLSSSLGTDSIARSLLNAGRRDEFAVPTSEGESSLDTTRTPCREPSAHGWARRWQPGVPESCSVLGLWEDAAQVLGSEANANKAQMEGSSQDKVDTPEEVTEWARRIQASIESMNKLVDNFQVAGVNTSRPGESGALGRGPRVSSSPSSSPLHRFPDATTPVHPPADGVEADARASITSLRTEEESSLLTPGVEIFASAQLGFRRGLEGLLAERSHGGTAGTGQTDSKATSRGAVESRFSGHAERDDGYDSSDHVSRCGVLLGGRVLGTDKTAFTNTIDEFGERLLRGSDHSWSELRDRNRLASSITITSPGQQDADNRGHNNDASTSLLSRTSAITPIDPLSRVSRLVDDSLNPSLTSDETESSGWGETKGEGSNLMTSPRRRPDWDTGPAYPKDSGSGALLAATTGDGAIRGVEVGHGRREGSVTSCSSNSFGPDLEAEIQSLEALAASLQQRKMLFDPKPGLLVQQQQELEEHRRAIRAGSIAGSSTASFEFGRDDYVLPRAGEKSANGSKAEALGIPCTTSQEQLCPGEARRSPPMDSGVQAKREGRVTWKLSPFLGQEKEAQRSLSNDGEDEDNAQTAGNRAPTDTIASSAQPQSKPHEPPASGTNAPEQQPPSEPYDDFLRELRSLREAVAELAPQRHRDPDENEAWRDGVKGAIGSPTSGASGMNSGACEESRPYERDDETKFSVLSADWKRRFGLELPNESSAEERNPERRSPLGALFRELPPPPLLVEEDEVSSDSSSRSKREACSGEPERVANSAADVIDRDYLSTASRDTDVSSKREEYSRSSATESGAEGKDGRPLSANPLKLLPSMTDSFSGFGANDSPVKPTSRDIAREFGAPRSEPNQDREPQPDASVNDACNTDGRWADEGTEHANDEGKGAPASTMESPSRGVQGVADALGYAEQRSSMDTSFTARVTGIFLEEHSEDVRSDAASSRQSGASEPFNAEANAAAAANPSAVRDGTSFGSDGSIDKDDSDSHLRDQEEPRISESMTTPDRNPADLSQNTERGVEDDGLVNILTRRRSEGGSQSPSEAGTAERVPTTERLSIDASLVETKRPSAEELSPLEAPGWGSLMEFIEGLSMSSGSSRATREELEQQSRLRSSTEGRRDRRRERDNRNNSGCSSSNSGDTVPVARPNISRECEDEDPESDGASGFGSEEKSANSVESLYKRTMDGIRPMDRNMGSEAEDSEERRVAGRLRVSLDERTRRRRMVGSESHDISPLRNHPFDDPADMQDDESREGSPRLGWTADVDDTKSAGMESGPLGLEWSDERSNMSADTSGKGTSQNRSAYATATVSHLIAPGNMGSAHSRSDAGDCSESADLSRDGGSALEFVGLDGLSWKGLDETTPHSIRGLGYDPSDDSMGNTRRVEGNFQPSLDNEDTSRDHSRREDIWSAVPSSPSNYRDAESGASSALAGHLIALEESQVSSGRAENASPINLGVEAEGIDTPPSSRGLQRANLLSGNDETLSRDSHKTSEPSLDSLGMYTSEAITTERGPRQGGAVSWNMETEVSLLGNAESKDAGGGEDADDEKSPGERSTGELAAVFSSRASAFISRSKAREAVVRQRRESRQKTREEAAASSSAPPDTGVASSPDVNRSAAQTSQRENVGVAAGTEAARPSASIRFDGSADRQGRRRVSTEEARKRTTRLYNNLPEVREARERKEKSEERVRRLVEARAKENERSRLGRQGRGGRGGGAKEFRK